MRVGLAGMWVAAAALLPFAVLGQAKQQTTGTLQIAGQPDLAPLVRINGIPYIDIESLARLTHASVQYQGNRTILTFPATGTTDESSQAKKPPQLSERFLGTMIEALTQLREWRVSLVNAVQNNYPVEDSWVGRLRRSADAKLQLASAAATTELDQQALQQLQNVFSNMQQMSQQFVGAHAQASYISSDSFVNNAQDQKILTCERALANMAATKQYQDEPSCH